VQELYSYGCARKLSRRCAGMKGFATHRRCVRGRRAPTELPALDVGRVRGVERIPGKIFFPGERGDHADEVAEAVVLRFELSTALAARRFAGCFRHLAVATLDDDHGRPSQGVAASKPGLPPAYGKRKFLVGHPGPVSPK